MFSFLKCRTKSNIIKKNFGVLVFSIRIWYLAYPMDRPNSHLNSYTGASGNLIVTLDGDAKLYHSNREGHYILTSTPVNGKQYWIQEQSSNAIWYDKKFRNWKIGDKKHSGTSICSLHSTFDGLGPETTTTWKYWNDDRGWRSTSNMFKSLSMFFV